MSMSVKLTINVHYSERFIYHNYLLNILKSTRLMFRRVQRNANVLQLNSDKLQIPVSSQYHTVAVTVSFFF